MKRHSQSLLLLPLIAFLLLVGCQPAKMNGSTPPPQTEPSHLGLTDTDTPKEPSNPPQTPSQSPPQAKDPKENEGYYVDAKSAIHAVQTDSKEKIVLLTFDDSPSGKSTPKILDLLDKYKAKAIWFVNGYYAEKHPELLKEIQKRGHLIGNHTWWHENLKKLSPEKTKEEIVSLNDFVEKVTGTRPVYFRPPFGVNTDDGYKVLKEEKMQAMNWTWGSLDWEYKKAADIEKNVITHVRSGSNILFHDKEITSEALEGILKKLTEDGYHFVLPTEVRIRES